VLDGELGAADAPERVVGERLDAWLGQR